MTEENKIEGVNAGCNNGVKQECFCKSEWFKKFLLKTLAVFVGVFCALSLFSALHRPKLPPCPYGHGPMMRPAHVKMHHFEGYRGPRGGFCKKMERRDFQRFERKNFQRPVIKPELPKQN